MQAVVDCQAPRHVKDLRSFLGLANYYRKFIAGYSKKATTLIDLLKKDTKWVWSERCDEAFQNLKMLLHLNLYSNCLILSYHLKCTLMRQTRQLVAY